MALRNSDDDSLNERRARLDAKLAKKRVESDIHEDNGQEKRKGYALAIKISSEFIAGILVGVLLGFVIDKLAGTTPWGLIIFLLLGFAAGVLNVLRSIGTVAEPKVLDQSNTLDD